MEPEKVKAFNCRDVSTHVALGDLKTARGWERFKLGFHLTYCWFCRKYERQLRTVAEAFRRASQQKIAKTDTEALQKRIIQNGRI